MWVLSVREGELVTQVRLEAVLLPNHLRQLLIHSLLVLSLLHCCPITLQKKSQLKQVKNAHSILVKYALLLSSLLCHKTFPLEILIVQTRWEVNTGHINFSLSGYNVCLIDSSQRNTINTVRTFKKEKNMN